MAASKILSLHGKGLKLDTRQDLEPWLKDVDPTIIEEIHLGGNTIGVEASKALAEFIDKTTSIKVSTGPPPSHPNLTNLDRRLCRHLHWSSDLRDPSRTLLHLRRLEEQNFPHRDQPQR